MGRADGALVDQYNQREADALATSDGQALQVRRNGRHAAENWIAAQWCRFMLLREHN